MGFTNFWRDIVLDELFGATDYTPEATYYFGLSTTAPADDGTNVTEPSGNGYARVSIANNATNFPAAIDGVQDNGTEISFPQATGFWGTVTHFVLYNASTGGNLLAYGTLTTSKSIDSGDTASFPIGDFTVQLS